MTTRTTTKKNTKKNNLKKNAVKNLKASRKKITGLVNDIIGRTENTLNDLVGEAKRRLR